MVFNMSSFEKKAIIILVKTQVEAGHNFIQKKYPNYEGSLEQSTLDPLFQDLIDELGAIEKMLEEKEVIK